jgi:predicted permease
VRASGAENRLARAIGRLCGAWYRALLFVYPRSFREAHGQEAAAVFAAACEESWRQGETCRFLWRVARSPLDVLRHGAAERIAARHAGAPGQPTAPSDIVRDIVQEIHMPRLIRGHRGYALLAVSSLALSVGSTLAVFTVVNGLWLKPVPIPDPDRLVMIVGATAGEGDVHLYSLDWLETEDHWTMFDTVAGQLATSGDRAGQAAHLSFDAAGGEVETLGVTSTYFDVLRQAIRGRDFTREDSRPGAEPVAIISDRFWSRAFGRRDDVIGALAPASPVPVRIIGVAQPGFEGARRGERTDVWLPAALAVRLSPAGATESEPGGVALLLARLRPGQTLEAAKQQLVEHSLATTRMGPEPLGQYREYLEAQRVVPLSHVFGSPSSRTIAISEGRAAAVVAGLAALVLLGSCATLMALVLVHYERRRRELSVRLALGASRLRLAAQLGTEFGWLAVAGTAGAIVVALAGLQVLPALSLPGGVDLGRLDLSIDWRVMGAAIGTTTLTLATAAALPLLRFTRGDLAGEIVAVRSTTSASSHRLRQTLLALHVSATIVVLVSAGLFVRAVVHGFTEGPGFDVDRIVSLRLRLPPIQERPGASIPAQLAEVGERMLRLTDSLGVLPGVAEVASGGMPIGLERMNDALTMKTVETGGEQRQLAVGELRGGPRLTEALGVPVVSGRSLTPDDAAGRGGIAPVVISASLARTLWPQDDPVGQVVQVGRGGRYEVVGVVRDFAYGSMTQPTAGVIVRVFENRGGITQSFILRADHPEATVQPIRTLVAGLVPDLHRMTIATGRDIVARDLGRQRLGAWFFSGFGLIALVLGAGGVFGLVAYLAESRRREFGVRVALGATPRDLVRRGVAAGLIPVGIGAVTGFVAAALVARLLATALPGLSTLDPVTYASVALLMTACSAVAGLTGAWRLRGVAPAEALRAE